MTYEVAESILRDLISYASVKLRDATHRAVPDSADVARWKETLRGYTAERRSRNLHNPESCARASRSRGAELRDLTGRRPGGTSV